MKRLLMAVAVIELVVLPEYLWAMAVYFLG